ncbi:hypothetical protein RFI_22068 [Reticulomyxa filosa]|uniref:Uncharacterized protein n=1 Tax=Reticulomyxa filosa TaxID=46433 RepID=X6MPC7_RETFI|nr:hypothetical protein RFI_22068 [Reticulomyxa filosa]|eukprot:ETO15297.1 hypothetical protein RFI_22068 [Reticulomyxa filosa]
MVCRKFNKKSNMAIKNKKKKNIIRKNSTSSKKEQEKDIIALQMDMERIINEDKINYDSKPQGIKSWWNQAMCHSENNQIKPVFENTALKMMEHHQQNTKLD